MSTYTFINGDVEKTAEEWGIDAESVRFSLGNQVADTLDVTFVGMEFTDDVPWAYDSLVTAKKDGTVVFVGRVMTAPVMGSPRKECISLTVHGPWQELEEVFFEQEWNTKSGTEQERIGIIIMGQELGGGRQNTAACVQAIFDYAALCGLNLQLGSNMAALEIPLSEVRTQTLAALLRLYLAWQPSAVTEFDYTTTPPTLNIVERSAAAVVALAIDGVRLSEVSLTPRHDLVPPGVIVTYVLRYNFNGSPAISTQVDAYPLDTNPLNRRVLKATFDLDGGSTSQSTQRQKLETRTLPTDWSDLDWWKLKISWLNNANVSSVDIELDDSPFIYDWGSEQNTHFYLNEIVAGSYQDWMSKLTSPAIHVVVGKVRAKCNFKYTDPESQAVSIRRVLIEANVTSTNAVTGTYTKTTNSYTTGQVPPTGLAEAYYNSVKDLQYDGSFKLKEAEPFTSPIRPGMVVNLSNGRAEWASMRAQIQRVDIHVSTGVTVITVGPSKHLGWDDLMRLMQPMRLQASPTNDETRATGKSKSANAETDGALAVPNDSGAIGAGTPKRTDWGDKSDSNKELSLAVEYEHPQIWMQRKGGNVKQIQLSTADIPDAVISQIVLREFDYCSGGTKQKILVLASAPY